MRQGARALPRARGVIGPLSGYMGTSDTFDRALASFSVAYADQNEKDHAALKRAIRAGRIEARFEEDTDKSTLATCKDGSPEAVSPLNYVLWRDSLWRAVPTDIPKEQGRRFINQEARR